MSIYQCILIFKFWCIIGCNPWVCALGSSTLFYACISINYQENKETVVAVDFYVGNLLSCTHMCSKWDLKMPDIFL